MIPVDADCPLNVIKKRLTDEIVELKITEVYLCPLIKPKPYIFATFQGHAFYISATFSWTKMCKLFL